MLDVYFECICGYRRPVHINVNRIRISVNYLREISYESCNKCGKYNEMTLLVEEKETPGLVVVDETVPMKKEGEKDGY
jgi:hypothetical protein